jgi:hypothetical protein
MTQSNSRITAFGEIIFIPKGDAVPPLPDMDLLFFNEEGAISPWRAVCIDLEIDACGTSMDHAWENLKSALISYIAVQKVDAGSLIGTVKNIIDVAFTESEQKRQYINIYREAKKYYTMRRIEDGQTPDPIKEEKKRLKILTSGNDLIRYIITELTAA